MIDTAIVLGTYNRGHLLRRSLLHYPKDVYVLVMDDSSTDNTFEVCIKSDNFIGHQNVYKTAETGWRDSASYLNRGIRQCLAMGFKYIYITHPEIIPGRTTISSANARAKKKDIWVNCKGYYLSHHFQGLLEDWMTAEEVRQLPGFYTQTSAEFMGSSDYLPVNIDRCITWHSWIFGGGSAEMWQYFGGVTPFDKWGSVDVDLNDRRRVAGMTTITPYKLSDFVIHQNHDDLNTPRDMVACMSGLYKYETKQQALKPELLL